MCYSFPNLIKGKNSGQLLIKKGKLVSGIKLIIYTGFRELSSVQAVKHRLELSQAKVFL